MLLFALAMEPLLELLPFLTASSSHPFPSKGGHLRNVYKASGQSDWRERDHALGVGTPKK